MTPARLLYTLAMSLLVPYALLRMLVRGVRNHGYWRHWDERFGWAPVPLDADDGRRDPRRPTWVHAVSVGEVVAARPLVDALLARGEPVCISVGTPTGRARAVAAFGGRAPVAYVPFDLPPCVWLRRLRWKPARVVLMETELWPNLIAAFDRRSPAQPVVLANARLSARSARGYARIAWLTRPMLAQLYRVGAQARGDARRLVALGARSERVSVTGSTKFDIRPGAMDVQEGQGVRRVFGASQSVVIAGSTHPGEDEIVLAAFARLRDEDAGARLMLVPRHPERFRHVAGLARQRGYSVALRSQWPRGATGADVLVGDTMGELMVLYAAADVAVVCGSFVEVGGHNPIEPASLGVPVLCGPHVFNFEAITRTLARAGGLRQIDAPALGDALVALLASDDKRAAMAAAGNAVAAGGRGATQALLAMLPAGDVAT